MSSLLKEMRDTAQSCSNIGVAVSLRKVADELAFAITEFSRTKSANDLREVNALYAFGTRVLKATTPMPEPTSPTQESLAA